MRVLLVLWPGHAHLYPVAERVFDVSAMPGPADLVPQLERLTARHRTGGGK
jgi:hypothetical protein